MYSFIKVFEYQKVNVDAAAYSFNKLEISIEILMKFSAASANMTETDFELYNIYCINALEKFKSRITRMKTFSNCRQSK